MSTSFPLPPSGRDFLIYQRITVDHASTWTVAEELHISQTRVRQIVKKVLHWLAQSLPADSDLDDAAKLRLSQHIAADRLQHYLIEANRLWKETGHIRYINLVLRIITAQSKIPAFSGDLEALAADAIEGPLAEDIALPPPTAAKTERQRDGQTERPGPTAKSLSPSLLHSVPPSSPPPPRDCSPKSTSPTSAALPLSSEPSPSSSPPALSADLSPTKSAARKAFFAPAHPATAPGQESPVTELKITPQQLGFSTTKSLSRRERRRVRQKMQAK